MTGLSFCFCPIERYFRKNLKEVCTAKKCFFFFFLLTSDNLPPFLASKALHCCHLEFVYSLRVSYPVNIRWNGRIRHSRIVLDEQNVQNAAVL